MSLARAFPAFLPLAVLASCASPSYVDKGTDESSTLGLNDVVFQVHEAYKTAPPDCVAILPLKIQQKADPQATSDVTAEDADKVRLSLFAHLSTQSKREVRLERVDHVLAEVKDDLKALGEGLQCDALLEGEVTEYGSHYYGVYSRVAVGADLKMIRASDGTLLWEGHHTAVSHGGSVPLDPVGIAMDLADAATNISDEQILRVTDDLTRRLVSTIPNNRVTALDDPPTQAKAAPPTDEVAQAEKLLAQGDTAGALAAANRAIAADPKRGDAWFVKGRVLMLDKRYDQAQPAIVKAIALDDGNAHYLNALGAVNSQSGQNDRALAAYQMAIDRDPSDGFAWYNTAVIHFNAGNPTQAATGFYSAGMAYLKTGDAVKAERALSDLKDLARSGADVKDQIKNLETALSNLTRRTL